MKDVVQARPPRLPGVWDGDPRRRIKFGAAGYPALRGRALLPEEKPMINCEKIEEINHKWKEAREEAREHCLTQERALVEAQIDHLFDIIKAVADYWHVFYEDPETPTPDTIDVFREAEDKLKKVLMHLIQLGVGQKGEPYEGMDGTE